MGPDGTESDRSRQGRNQVPPRGGPQWHPTRRSAANAHDSTSLLPLIDAVPPIVGPRGRPGRPRQRPAKLHADTGYDYPSLRRALRARGITPRIARRGIDSSERLGRHRWVVERTQSWLLGCRGGVRYERRADLLRGLLHPACALICLNFLAPATR
jgi:transposase